MEAQEETMAITKEQSLILKGKRTKRQRLQSPIPFSIAPPISSHGEEDEESTSLDDASMDKNNLDATEEVGEDGDTDNNSKGNVESVMNGVCYAKGVTISASSASSSSNINTTVNGVDEEDQDMAHCLILLAQGHSLSRQQQQQKGQHRQHVMIHHNETGNNNNNNNGFRFTSRRFLETSSANGNNGGAKAGYYVYQCKTCDRTFPSFQALGGHRASHKKPKALHSGGVDLKKSIYNDTVSLHLNNITTTSINNNNNNHNQRGLVMYGTKVMSNNKVHECGICGAEFTSGQALGGHMRRHRGAVVAAAAAVTTANTALSLSPMSFEQSDGQDYPAKKRRSTVVSLDLDLNLPAPEDENNRVNALGFASKKEHQTEHEQQHQQEKQREEQKSLVLSTASLVDCHY